MSRPVIAAVQLGCCHEAERCLLCAPAPKYPVPDYVSALLGHTVRERSKKGREVWVGFYGGRPPSDALLDAIDGAPFSVRVRPDLLSRAEAKRLVQRGARSIELDVLTLDNAVLRALGRHYRRRVVLEQLQGLRDLGVQVGLVLAQGLPGTDHASCMADAQLVVDKLDTVRLHPVLVLADSGLRLAHMDATYEPLALGAAVTVCRSLMDLFEAHDVRVTRVGMQPGPDGLGRAVAGPRHSSFRELVETRRTLDRIRSSAPASFVTGSVVIRCAPADVSRVRGPYNQHMRTLRAELGVSDLHVEADPSLSRGSFQFSEAESR